MQSIEILSRAHAAITDVLARFEELLARALVTGTLDAAGFARFLEFFEERVDGQHQEEEERVFLPRVLTRARGRDVQRVRAVLDEHAEQRLLLVRMRCHLDRARAGRSESVASLVELGRQYAERQRLHAAWEDAILLPLAERVLSARDDRSILNGLRHLEHAWGGSVEDAARRVEAWLDRRLPAILA